MELSDPADQQLVKKQKKKQKKKRGCLRGERKNMSEICKLALTSN